MIDLHSTPVSCPVTKYHTLAQADGVSSDESLRYTAVGNLLTPKSLEGAHEQLVGLDIAFDEHLHELGKIKTRAGREAHDTALQMKAAILRLLEFTSEVTGLPA